MATLARMMIQMLNWVVNRFSDLAVQATGHKAFTSMQGIERNASKNARVTTKRKGNLEKEINIVPLDMFKRLIESKAHEDAGGSNAGVP